MKTQSHATSRVFIGFGNCWVDIDLAEIIPKAKILPVNCASDLKRRPWSLSSMLLRIPRWWRGGEMLYPVEVRRVQRQPRLGCWGSSEPRPVEAPVPSAEQQRAQTLQQSPLPSRLREGQHWNKSKLKQAWKSKRETSLENQRESKRGSSFRAQMKSAHVGCAQLCYENSCHGHLYDTHVDRFIFKCKEMC